MPFAAEFTAAGHLFVFTATDKWMRFEMSNFQPTIAAEEKEEPVSKQAALEHRNLTIRKREGDRLLKCSPTFFLSALKMADTVALLGAGFGGYFIYFGLEAYVSPANQLMIYLNTVTMIVSLHMVCAYRPEALHSLSSLLNTMSLGTVNALLLIIVCGYFSPTLYWQAWTMLSAITSLALLLLNRIAVAQFAARVSRTHMLTESIVVVGANECAERIIEAIGGLPEGKIKVLGIFDDRVEREIPKSLRLWMLGSTNNLIEYIRHKRVDRVVVALPWIASERVEVLLKKMRTVPVRIDLVPNNVVWQFPAMNMERLGGVPVVTIANSRVDEQMGIVKRLEDLVISTLLLIGASPIFLLIALLTKLDSKGPVIFKQRRHGFNNQIFEVYKFRSMTVAACADVNVEQVRRNDSRVTRFGKFLRSSSLDELPQLFNVLLGQMSIVGPRPHAVQHNREYGAIISEYYARHNVKPGITGWAQVNGLRGETDTVEKMHRRVEYDLHYIEHWSLLLDLKIILKTVFVVWFHHNAY
jgi:Undecaprenyl-phosphate glucose phosphotransferase